jgi:hypothetical protein
LAFSQEGDDVALPRHGTEPGPIDLEALGLDATASAIYEHLLGNPDDSVPALAREVHCDRAMVEASLSQLIRAGLARVGDRTCGVEPLPPESALARQISIQQRDAIDQVGRLAALRDHVARLERSWRAGHQGEVDTREIEIIRDPDLIEERLKTLCMDARRRSLSLDCHRPGREFDDSDYDAIQVENCKLRMDVRGVYDLALLDNPSVMSYLERVAMPDDVRLLPRVPLQLRIVDDVAVMPVDPENMWAGVVLTRSPGIVMCALATFELAWSDATPLARMMPSTANPAPGVDPRLPRLLATGIPDDAVARFLGLSSRTVRRQVATLMDDLSVRSRLQLGIALERRGLV